jgi:NAD(P) transhydrogenase subunit alpha
MIVGIPKETFPGERRVAMVPTLIPTLAKAKAEVLVERGAGAAAGYPDAAYVDKGARVAASREELFREAGVIAQVRGLGANVEAGRADLALLREGQVVVALLDPLGSPALTQELAATGATVFAMELMPRITRAQSMDALSSMATVAGYKAVLLAADALPKMFPMLMTAAGTIAPARVFVVGAGVAGLQAISVARRLGAVVHAYDVRPVVKEQVQSLGAKFVELDLESDAAEGKDGYARAQDEAFYRRQREVMGEVVAQSDVVITTAQVPGRKAPTLVTQAMVEGMAPGSVVVDLAAEQGGNCELTRAGEKVEAHGVTILGPVNLPATVPFHASQMYGKNVATFLLHLVKDGELEIDREDEITRGTLVAHASEVVHSAVREALSRDAQADERPKEQ